MARGHRGRTGTSYNPPGEKGVSPVIIGRIASIYGTASLMLSDGERSTDIGYRTHVIGRNYYRTKCSPITSGNITPIIGRRLSDYYMVTSDNNFGVIATSDNVWLWPKMQSDNC